MTKSEFTRIYREYVYQNYKDTWASDPTKLDAFMAKVEVTLATKAIPWRWDCDGTRVAWREMGGKGTPTLKALRALPA